MCGSQVWKPGAYVSAAPGVVFATLFCWPCISDLMTSVKDTVKGRCA